MRSERSLARQTIGSIPDPALFARLQLKIRPLNLQPLTFNQEVLGSSPSALTKKQHQYKGLQPASGAVAQSRHLCSPHGRFGTPPERLRPRAGCQAPASRKNPPPGLLGDLGMWASGLGVVPWAGPPEPFLRFRDRRCGLNWLVVRALPAINRLPSL